MIKDTEPKKYRGWDEVNKKYVYGSLYVDKDNHCYILEPTSEGVIPSMISVARCHVSKLILHCVISEDEEDSLYAGKEVYVYDDDIINIKGFDGRIEERRLTYGIVDEVGDWFNGQDYPDMFNQLDFWPLLKILETGGKIIERHYVGYPESQFRYWVHPHFVTVKADLDPEANEWIVSIWDGNFPKYSVCISEDDDRMKLVEANKVEEFYNSCDYECDWFETNAEWYDWIMEKKAKENY